MLCCEELDNESNPELEELRETSHTLSEKEKTNVCWSSNNSCTKSQMWCDQCELEEEGRHGPWKEDKETIIINDDEASSDGMDKD